MWGKTIVDGAGQMADEYNNRAVPRSLFKAHELEQKVQLLLYPAEVRNNPDPLAPWEFVREADVEKISIAVDELLQALQIGTKELFDQLMIRKSAARTWHMTVAVLGSLLLVLGRTLGWWQDRFKAQAAKADDAPVVVPARAPKSSKKR